MRWPLPVIMVMMIGCAARPVGTPGDWSACQPCFKQRWASTNLSSEQRGLRRYCYEVRSRKPTDGCDTSLRDAYGEEFEYVRQRRQLIAGAPDAPAVIPPHMIGIALSGGGIRSASFNLGTLQALYDSGVWRQTDYMSATSGGGYLAGWVQAHLGQNTSLTKDEYWYDVRAANARDLFENHGDHVEHLRTHTGFLNEGGWLEGPRVFGDWLRRWPFHLVLDDVFHVRGWFNFQHVLNVYRHRIERTYLRGTPAAGEADKPIASLALESINAPEQAAHTPYLVLTANLTNSGKSLTKVPCSQCPKPGEKSCSQWNFEFTRDFVGSDAVGYVDTRAFGLRPEEVLRDATGVPKAVVIRYHPDDTSITQGIEKSIGFSGVERFGLSEAMAAAGAAFDSAAVAYQLDLLGVNELGHFLVGGVFNLYLGAEVPNFARAERHGWPVDYAKMMTVQRIPRFVDPGARWLYVTDGGHYDNLAVLALLRRGVQCVMPFDADSDPGRKYEDLKTLRRRTHEDLKMDILPPPGGFPVNGEDREGHYRMPIVDERGATKAIMLYVKASAAEGQAHMQPLDLESRIQADLETLRQRDKERVTRHQFVPEQKSGDINVAINKFYNEIETRSDKLSKFNRDSMAEIKALQSCKDEQRPTTPEEAPPATGKGPPPLCETLMNSCKPNQSNGAITDCLVASISDDGGPTTATNALANCLCAHIRGSCGSKDINLSECIAAEVEQGVARVQLSMRHSSVDEDYDGARFQEVLDRVLPDPGRDAVVASIVQRVRSVQRDKDDRADRIKKILAFARTSGSGQFPHNSTFLEWYDWERFDAYRTLGYQQASTYLDRFDPDESSTDGDPLAWCRFADLPPESTKRSPEAAPVR